MTLTERLAAATGTPTELPPTAHDRSEFQHDLASLCHEMHGAADWYAEHPEYATDERLAATFRDYAARIGARIEAWNEREEAGSFIRQTTVSGAA